MLDPANLNTPDGDDIGSYSRVDPCEALDAGSPFGDVFPKRHSRLNAGANSNAGGSGNGAGQ